MKSNGFNLLADLSSVLLIFTCCATVCWCCLLATSVPTSSCIGHFSLLIVLFHFSPFFRTHVRSIEIIIPNFSSVALLRGLASRLLYSKHGRGALLFKADLRNAFRLCPVAPSDWPLLGIYWNNAYFVDKFLPFGLRSSPFLFNRLADALCWVATNRFGVTDLVHYLDDFLSIQPGGSPDQARKQFFTLLATMEHLQVPLAEGTDKVCSPCISLTFLGIELDTVVWEMRLPATKLSELQAVLDSWVTRKTVHEKAIDVSNRLPLICSQGGATGANLLPKVIRCSSGN